MVGIDAGFRELNTHAKLDVLRLVAGMRVKVVRRAPVELVALAKFPPNHDTQCKHRDPSRYQADIAQQGASVVGGAIDGIFDLFAEFAERARELHGLHHNAVR